MALGKTSFIDPFTGEAVEQEMQHPDGVPKGIETVVRERKLWNMVRNTSRVRCQECAVGGDTTENHTYCCMYRALSTQPDFANQKEWLQETVENSGHLIIFFPKFHCELNFIELVWGFMKRELRDNCDFNFDNLCLRIHELLDNTLPTKTTMIRKFHNRCLRFMDGYSKGLYGPLLDYAMKQYSSHRMFPSAAVVAKFEEEYRAQLQKK